MSMSLGSVNASTSTLQATLATVNPTVKEAFKDLTQSLKAGDVDGARQAYATLIKNAPAGGVYNKDSPFAQMGKALISGDVDAAKQAYANMIRGQAGRGKTDLPPVGDVPPSPSDSVVTSSTGGSAGSTLNVVA